MYESTDHSQCRRKPSQRGLQNSIITTLQSLRNQILLCARKTGCSISTFNEDFTSIVVARFTSLDITHEMQVSSYTYELQNMSSNIVIFSDQSIPWARSET